MATSCSKTSSRIVGNAEESNRTARALIDTVFAVIGGHQALGAIETLAVQYTHTQYPEAPNGGNADPLTVEVMQVRDFSNGRQFYEERATDGGDAGERIVVVPGAAFRVNLLTNEMSTFPTDAATSARYSGLQLRWYVYATLNEAYFAGVILRQAPDTTDGGRTFHVVTYPGTGTETIQLWIDAQTNRLARRTITVNDPILGAATASFRFEDYADVGGLPIPMTVLVYNGERLHEQFEIMDIRINAEIQESAFEPPSGH